jgi:hypothetical protein
MNYRIRVFALTSLFILSSLSGTFEVTAVVLPPAQDKIEVTTNEGAAMKSLRALLTAQTKFQNTIGNGEYGGLKELHNAGLIDSELSLGLKEGYRFTIVTKKATLTTHPAVDLVARPIEYGKNARRSFYLTEAGVLLTSDVRDAPLTSMKPFAQGPDTAKNGPAEQRVASSDDDSSEELTAREVAANESAVVAALGIIHGAQMKYFAKEAAYGSLKELLQAGLIDREQSIGTQHGYVLNLKFSAGKTASTAAFSISASPETYGGSGRTSFFIDQTGIVRGGDKEGGPADATDPAINN